MMVSSLSVTTCFFLLVVAKCSAFGFRNPSPEIVPLQDHYDASPVELPPLIAQKINNGHRLSHSESKIVRDFEKAKFMQLKSQGFDEVSNTPESVAMRAYRLRKKKIKGLFRKRQVSIADVLFPGVSPQSYDDGEPMFVYADLVESSHNPIPYEYYDLPGCDEPREGTIKKEFRERKNLGSRLQGHEQKVTPFHFVAKRNLGCTFLCSASMDTKTIRWMQKLVRAHYRVQLTLDRLPILMRSTDHNFVSRGYPLGFQVPEDYEGLNPGDYYLFNHLKFIVTYNEGGGDFEGIRITGFDVIPVSIEHDLPNGGVDESVQSNTCQGQQLDNDPSMYLNLRGGGMRVAYSYEVEWLYSDVLWEDRWDVYLMNIPDDELHYFSIVNSLMIVLFLTGAIATIMIRTLRKDIAIYNEMETLEESAEETGWKLVHGDVFRPPQFMPMALAVAVGTGAQICVAFGLAMLCGVVGLLNPVQKGQTLTALIILYVLCGSVAGYVSSRLFKFMDQTAWKINIFATAMALPGFLLAVFLFLNIWLSFAGAATAVSFFTIVKMFCLWALVSCPLVFVGGAMGLKAPKIEVPTKTNQIARIVPSLQPWHVKPQFTIPMGGVLPFGSVCIELAFIMSALWLHQVYYVLGFLLAVLLILVATCAQVSIVLTYLQLCAEDHRWWWNSFLYCASAGFYLFLYSLWFLSSRLEMVGVLPVVIYLTYMGMISICFSLVCGSVGFLATFVFTRTIYGAVKVD